MSQIADESGGTGPSHRMVEVGVAGAIAVLALIGIYGSLKVGIGWADDGPRAGFFPFYVSLLVLVSSVINAATAFRAADKKREFAAWSQLRQVMSVLIPLIVYVTLVPYLGIYLASAMLIAFFMRWLGRYPWIAVGAVAIAVPVLAFLMFEIWFLVPLPKGPVESLLGY